jgi:hypothetical protein
MGNYAGSGPQRWTYRREFTDQELIQNWTMILTNKELMERVDEDRRGEEGRTG